MISRLKKEFNHFLLFRIIVVVLLLLPFFILGRCQNDEIDEKLSQCGKFTIATPVKTGWTTQMHYVFSINGKVIKEKVSVGAEDIGNWFFTPNDLMNRRYWIKVNCKDTRVNRIYWEILVPDTLQYIPGNGWDAIPYGLGDGKNVR